ncbi:hypothetical protein N658DRAFT_271153 [Parathielavia hyrcaniae]|uniref:Uncharacterized protein n=1 Tax=Parathielavia hyrcaniae TaxID=113614 RepID=A0AAN6SY20_9PEZI|nr:hypothetical protein N658DRAFT_271153 [Parathielavia hyrcaniae]
MRAAPHQPPMVWRCRVGTAAHAENACCPRAPAGHGLYAKLLFYAICFQSKHEADINTNRPLPCNPSGIQARRHGSSHAARSRAQHVQDCKRVDKSQQPLHVKVGSRAAKTSGIISLALRVAAAQTALACDQTEQSQFDTHSNNTPRPKQRLQANIGSPFCRWSVGIEVGRQQTPPLQCRMAFSLDSVQVLPSRRDSLWM